jgi:hypothetical protein
MLKRIKGKFKDSKSSKPRQSKDPNAPTLGLDQTKFGLTVLANLCDGAGVVVPGLKAAIAFAGGKNRSRS